MPIATFRGERSVAEVVDKLYVKLTPRQRETVEAAILKANPRLRDIGNLRDGTILHVPDLPKLRAKTRTNRTLENPVTQVAATLVDDLDGYGRRLAERVRVDQQDAKAQLTLLKSARFKAALGGAPHLQELAEQAARAIEARSKTIKERQGTLETALKRALADLEEMKR
ncbi:hypothetical protein QLQ85_15910 [Halomonas sp. M4R5S39]|uniref:hypothetical protein n=1 Tax=Halomonas kalidii TaxID=3043293 RepID=UPI0024A907C7|nr:hypothetical protein [Halomonas kalidii]MDI5986279.1 hypothetical protein [Halomonas kalidii]